MYSSHLISSILQLINIGCLRTYNVIKRKTVQIVYPMLWPATKYQQSRSYQIMDQTRTRSRGGNIPDSTGVRESIHTYIRIQRSYSNIISDWSVTILTVISICSHSYSYSVILSIISITSSLRMLLFLTWHYLYTTTI